MAHNIFHRIGEGLATISDFTKAAQTEAETRRLQRELEERRRQQQPVATAERPTTTGNIFQDIARGLKTAQEGIQAIQLPTREPAREPKKLTEQEREELTARPIAGFPIRRFQESQKAYEEIIRTQQI